MGLLLYVESRDGREREEPEVEVHDCLCFCEHTECESLRRRCWCRHWVVVHWVTKVFLDPPLLIGKIIDCLRDGTTIRRWGSSYMDSQGEYHQRVLLLADPAGPGFGDGQLARLNDPEGCRLGVSFARGASFVGTFRCCRQYLREGIPGWIATIRGHGHLLPTFSFGDTSLLDELDVWMQLDDVQRATSP